MIAFAPSRDLVGRAVKVDQRLVYQALVDLVAQQLRLDLVHYAIDGAADALAAELERRQCGVLPPRTRRWTRRKAQPARPTEPSSRTTSTSTVGFPRESRICLACAASSAPPSSAHAPVSARNFPIARVVERPRPVCGRIVLQHQCRHPRWEFRGTPTILPADGRHPAGAGRPGDRAAKAPRPRDRRSACSLDDSLLRPGATHGLAVRTRRHHRLVPSQSLIVAFCIRSFIVIVAMRRRGGANGREDSSGFLARAMPA